MAGGEREIAQAREHPRGTERRVLLPYREALGDVAAYARLPRQDRDAIVALVEVRRRLREEHGLDHDDRNLADPLLPYASLRAHVIRGEALAAGAIGLEDGGGDLRELVTRIRGG